MRSFMNRKALWLNLREGKTERFFPSGVMKRKAQVLITLGDWEEAEGIYRLILETIRHASLASEEAEALCDLALILHYRSNYQESQELVSMAMAIYKDLNDRRGIIRTLGMMGDAYNSWSDYRKALEYYHRMEELAEDLGLPAMTADAQRKIGIAHFWLGETTQALENLEKSRRIAEDLHNPKFLGGTIQAIGLTYRERLEFHLARPHLQEALRIFNQTGDQRSIGMALGSLAGLHYYLGEYTKALELYYRQVEIAERIGDKYFLSCACGDISAIYMDMGRLEEAFNMASQELALCQEAGDKLGIGDAHYRLGLVERLRGDLTAAGKNLDLAVEYGRQVQSGRFLPNYLLSKANLHYQMGQADAAREAMEEARRQAADFERRDILDSCRALELLLAYPSNPDKCEKDLLELAGAQPEDNGLKANIYYELWRCSANEEYRRQALELHRNLVAKKDCFEYRKIIDELEKG